MNTFTKVHTDTHVLCNGPDEGLNEHYTTLTDIESGPTKLRR